MCLSRCLYSHFVNGILRLSEDFLDLGRDALCLIQKGQSLKPR